MLFVFFVIGMQDLVVNLFLNLCTLTNALTDVVELSAANLTGSDEFNLDNVGRMERERLFNAATICNTSYGEGLRDTTAVLCNNGTLEDLDSLPCALFDTVVNLNGATDLDYRGILLNLLIYKSLNLIHCLALLKTSNIHAEHLQRTVLNLVLYAQRI